MPWMIIVSWETSKIALTQTFEEAFWLKVKKENTYSKKSLFAIIAVTFYVTIS